VIHKTQLIATQIHKHLEEIKPPWIASGTRV